MNLIKPKKLKTGDKISIIAPSGNVNKEKILAGKKYFEELGYKVELGENIFNSEKYLSASDELRTKDIHSAFSDTETKAIICARGGYGALRLVNTIDYNVIKNNPKIFCGYSDATVLNIMFLKKAGLITFSGPMIESDFSAIEINKFTKDEFFNTLTSIQKEISANNPKIFGNNLKAEGIILGGNLTTLTSLCGLDFFPDKNIILFAEDLNEPIYKIDRCFTQLLNINKFRKNITAICLGDFLGVNEDDINDYFAKLSTELNVPIIKGFPLSHTDTKTTLPIGAMGRLNETTLLINDYLT